LSSSFRERFFLTCEKSGLGSSNFNEQTAILTKVLPVIKHYKTVLLGDREFCSVKLASWLREQDLYFCLRLKKNEFVQIKPEIWAQLNALGLAPGISFFLEGIKVTQTGMVQKQAILGNKAFES
jgi:hypothetical protein